MGNFWKYNDRVSTGAGVSGLDTADGGDAISDNEIIRGDGTTGIQGSAITISDLTANIVTVEIPEPAATTGASQVGRGIEISASDAVASTDTDGAAAGGDVTISAGDAARFTSGNANGGDIVLDTGTGIGTGNTGKVIFPNSTAFAAPTIVWAGDSDTGFMWDGVSGDTSWVSNGTEAITLFFDGLNVKSTSGTIKFNSDTGLARSAAGVVKVTDGSTGLGSLYGSVVGSITENGASTNIKTSATTVNLSGATSTATGLFPAKCIQLGVTVRVTTLAASGDGGTSMNIGDGTDPDRYGATIAFAAGTTVNLSDATADPRGWAAAAGDVVFTCVGGTFNAGVVRVVAHYIDLTAPTS